MLERALISVFDKTGLDVFARDLHELGIELVASGGTATFIKELGLPVTRVDDLTEIPELLGGRVKTLHPKIHAAILARRDREDDIAALEEHAIDPFDLVCVNLYPFQQVAARKDVREEEAVEMIDVGGPSMLRAAAKNFIHVVPVCSIDRYGSIVAELKERGDIGMAARRALAAEAFAHTASYEASIAQWFSDRETFPDRLIVSLDRVVDLPYGENPHQRASYYAEAGARRHLLSRVDQLGGRQVSFNNLNDLDAARALLREFTVPACVIVKHANPCGVALATEAEEAYEKAHACDPVSAYGGVVAVNRKVEAGLAEKLSEQFVEVLIAPDYTEEAVEILRRKEATRILQDRERRGATPGERHFKRVLGGHARPGHRRRDRRPRDDGDADPQRPGRADVGRPALRLARGQARLVERDRARQGTADDRDRNRAAQPRRRREDRARQGARARPRPDRLGARLGRVLPVRGRPAARARRRDRGDHPAGRLEARRRGDRGRGPGRRRDGAHRPQALPPLRRRLRCRHQDARGLGRPSELTGRHAVTI